jgi:hypothetical protein
MLCVTHVGIANVYYSVGVYAAAYKYLVTCLFHAEFTMSVDRLEML